MLGFSRRQTSTSIEPVLEAYKTAIANAEPVGAFVNDNVMVTIAAFVRRGPRGGASQIAVDGRLNYLQSNVFRYHDTFPRPEAIPEWPELLPEHDRRDHRARSIAERAMICGDPDEALDAVPAVGATPAPTSWCSASARRTLEETLETIRLMGEHVIPKIDTDPVHRTTRFRDAAAAAMKK